MSKNISHLSSRKGLKDNLFNSLVEKSGDTGTVDKDSMKALAEDFLLGSSTIYSTVSFYDFMREENKDKKVYVCNGSACLCAGTQDKVHQSLAQHFAEEEIGEMCCLGRCHENSAFHYNGNNYSGDAINNLKTVIEAPQEFSNDHYNVSCHAKHSILTTPIDGVDEFKVRLEKALSQTAETLVAEISASKLRGRGGAGFPAGFKWDSCRQAKATPKFVVCNADEGDPGAYTDRYLLEFQPLSVLFGMMIAAYIAGSNHGVLYIRAEYPESVNKIKEAVENLISVGLLGNNILNSGFNFEFKIIKGAGAYICGEETALLASIEGRRPEVDIRPPFPTQEGLFKKPTIVNNVETFASVPFILENKGEAFAAIGTEKSSGTKLVCLDSFFKNPGVYEVEMGTPLQTVIDQLGGGFKTDVKALHIGGPLGGLVPKQKWSDLTIDFESFHENGFLLGHASIVSIPESMPMIKYLHHIFEFCAVESCGKCFPCRLGSTRGKEMMENAINGKMFKRELLEDLLETMQLGSLCALGGGVPLPIQNALKYFEDELAAYMQMGEIS